MRRHHPFVLKSRPRTPESEIRTWKESWGTALPSSRIFHVAFWNCYIGHLLWAQHYAKHCPLRVYLILHTTLQILIIPVWMMRKMKLGKMEQGCKKQISSKPAALRTSALLCYLCLPSLQQRTCNSTCSREKKERIWRFPLNLVLAPFIYLFSYQFFQ